MVFSVDCSTPFFGTKHAAGGEGREMWEPRVVMIYFVLTIRVQFFFQVVLVAQVKGV